MNNLNQYFPFLVFLTPLILFYQQSKDIILKVFRIFWKERQARIYSLRLFIYLLGAFMQPILQALKKVKAASYALAELEETISNPILQSS